jgi:pSer/pThr/pTyr-binding forkhead associated (FHA) protein
VNARVQIERDGALAAVVELVAERTLVGRAEHCDLRLDDPKVSGDHLEITRHGLALLATDLGSRNGTLLNGQRLTRPARLADGDTLTIGRCRLRVGIPAATATGKTELDELGEIALTTEELAVAAALVRPFRLPGALAARPASRAEIAEATHLAERTVTRRLETLASKLKLGAHEPRERAHLIAQRVLELGLDRQDR